MKKELYLGGEKEEDDYFSNSFLIYFKQLIKKIIKIFKRSDKK